MKKYSCVKMAVFFGFLLVVTIAYLPIPAGAQMPPSSLVEIPSSNAEFAGRLDELASKSGAAADYFRLKLAEIKLKKNDEKSALKLAERVDSRALKFWKDVVMAECFLAAGQSQKVLELLGELPPRPTPDLSFGETFYANLYKRALLTLRAAKLSLGRSADDELAELVANFPMDSDVARHSPDLSVLQKVIKLHALVFAYKYSLVDDIVTPSEITDSRLSNEQKCEALYDLGYGLRRNGGMAKAAVAAFEGILDQKCDRGLQARALYWIGSLGVAAQKDEEADSSLKRLAYEFKDHRFQDDGLYMLYKRAERLGQDSLVQKYFAELMKLPKGDMRDKLAFEKAFPHYMRGDFGRAVAILEPLVGSKAADETFTQVLYWYARSLQKMDGKGNAEKAMKVYKNIVSVYPYSFYATMAAARAGVQLKVPALPKLGGKPPSGSDGFFAIIDALNRDGFHNSAKQVMDLAMNLNPTWEISNQEFITRKYIEAQNYRKALDMAAQHFDSGVYGPVEAQSDPMFAAFFPSAFPEAVAGGYRLTGLPRGAIEGIMREESLFQSNVRSHAGATGLMQLMPATAAKVARGNAGGASAADLTDPIDNVLLGSAYLADMRRLFHDQLPLAIMAYNAGPGNVNKFLRNLRHFDLDEFIENIPISETRGYVKRVMRSMQVYGSIYNEEEFKKPFFNFQVSSK